MFLSFVIADSDSGSSAVELDVVKNSDQAATVNVQVCRLCIDIPALTFVSLIFSSLFKG